MNINILAGFQSKIVRKNVNWDMLQFGDVARKILENDRPFFDSNSGLFPPINNIDLSDDDDGSNTESALVPYRKGLKWGFSDRYKTIMIECIYDEVKRFNSAFSIVKLDGKYGVINEAGAVVIPIIHAGVNACEDCFLTNIGGEWSDEEHWVLGGKWGAYNSASEMIIPHIYDKIYRCKYNYYVYLDEKQGVVNKLGEIIAPCIYDKLNISESDNGGLDWICLEKDGVTTWLDSNNEPIEHFMPGENLYCGKKWLYRIDKGDKYGYVDDKGNIIIPAEFEEIDMYGDDRIMVCKNSKWGLYDLEGTVIFPPEANEPVEYYEDWLTAKIGDNYLARYKNEEDILFTDYADFFCNFNGYFVFAKDHGEQADENERSGYGCVDKDNNVIIPFKYSFITGFYSGVFEVTMDDKYFSLDVNGNELFSERYEFKTEYTGEYAQVFVGNNYSAGYLKQDGKWGVINSKGEVVIPIIYDSLYYDERVDLFHVYNNDQWGYISPDRLEYWED